MAVEINEERSDVEENPELQEQQVWYRLFRTDVFLAAKIMFILQVFMYISIAL